MEISECPVSMIHRQPMMVVLVKEIMAANRVKETSGAYPFGNDVRKWPCKWFDAVILYEGERNRVKAVREETADAMRTY